MKKIGIICEYNPFHNGHIYHLEKIKEMYNDSLIILVMSSSFTERGELSILNKWEKSEIALKYGVDLVIELPFEFASQSADVFARGAVTLLKELQVDTIVFGSESNNRDELIKIANLQLNNKDYDNKVKEYLDKGENYPSSMALAIKDMGLNEINLPNDILGLSYTKEIIKQNANIEVVTIKRTNDYHNKELNNSIVSASAIRNNLNNKDIINYVPSITYNYLKEKVVNNNYFLLLKYKIISEHPYIAELTIEIGL